MVPKNFIPKKSRVFKEVEGLLEPQTKMLEEGLEAMLKGCEDFLLEDNYYKKAKEIAEGIGYSKNDLQPFCDSLRCYKKNPRFRRIGIYLSALINKIIKEGDEVVLKLPYTETTLDSIGVELSKGKVVIRGDVGLCTGENMFGGTLVIEGHTDEFTGDDMSGGEIIVERSAGDWVGHDMRGGKIRAGKLGIISSSYISGEIYEDGKKVRPPI